MTGLTWDNSGERLFESGIDRGVFYGSDGVGIAWNGIRSVDENRSGSEPTSYYFEGVKYLETSLVDDFSAVLKAYTYPDEFLEYEGVATQGGGLYLDSQMPKTFCLSYRTLIGNDLEGTEFGYKIHFLYNLTATPTNKSYETLALVPNPSDFSWNLSGVPVMISGYRPTVHLWVDSRTIDADALAGLEAVIYGDEDSDPRFPTPTEILSFSEPIALREDLSDPGTYIIVNNAVGEDPDDEGTYLILKDNLHEDPDDPGTYLNGYAS